MQEKSRGIKNIQIYARCKYPIVSAYEFDFLKTEDVVQAILKPCTIYFIVQRPLLYINNLRIRDGQVKFEITDYSLSPPLECCFDPRANGFAELNEELLIDIQFYKQTPDRCEPYNDIGGIKLYDVDGKFLFWLTPQKYIHHCLTNRLKAEIKGDITSYIDYKVHYIGQAFSQEVWNRLTGHEKMQAILTREWPLDQKSITSSLEISLILLDIAGYDEMNIFPDFDLLLSPGVEPIVHEFDFEEDNNSFATYYNPKLAVDAEELTNEVEAMLINKFKPQYNKILFENYPNIKKGTRSAGYTESSLVLESLPAILKTDKYTQGVVLSSISNAEAPKGSP